MTAVTIDLWNTIIDSSGSSHRAEARAEVVTREARRLGYIVSSEQCKHAMAHGWKTFEHGWLTLQRTPSALAIVSAIWEHLGLPTDTAAMSRCVEVFERGVLDYPPALLPGAREALHELSESYPVAIVSDTAYSPGVVLRLLLEQLDVARFVTGWSFSDETGVSKPHNDAFTVIHRAFNTHPTHSVHIGDIPATDVIGAAAIGMKTVLYRGDGTSPYHALSADITPDAIVSEWSAIPAIVKSLVLQDDHHRPSTTSP
ncbi:MAG: HAD family hydrolase [Candidatus Kapabacteria bacterium]|nr:HAD family hydrolase [Candidatus Kapabacteria bacterium]